MGLGVRILCDLCVLYSFLLFVCHERIAEPAANIVVIGFLRPDSKLINQGFGSGDDCRTQTLRAVHKYCKQFSHECMLLNDMVALWSSFLNGWWVAYINGVIDVFTFDCFFHSFQGVTRPDDRLFRRTGVHLCHVMSVIHNYSAIFVLVIYILTNDEPYEEHKTQQKAASNECVITRAGCRRQ